MVETIIRGRFWAKSGFDYRGPYSRLWNGPTRGITSASQKIAALAQDGKVDHDAIQDIVAQHSTLCFRLGMRRYELVAVEKGTSANALARFFRFSLYNNRTLQFIGDFKELEEQHSALLLPFDIAQIHSDLSHKMADEIASIWLHAKAAKSLAFKFLNKLKLAYVLPMGLMMGAGGYLAHKFLPLSQLFSIDIPEIKILIDTVSGAALFGFVGYLFGMVVNGTEKNSSKKKAALAVWHELQNYRKQGIKPQRVKTLLGMLHGTTRLAYLTRLKYDQITALYPDPDLITEAALFAAQDTPIGSRRALAGKMLKYMRNYETYLALVINSLAIPPEILVLVAQRGSFSVAEKAMHILLERPSSNLGPSDYALLKKAFSPQVRILAYFCDPAETPRYLAETLYTNIHLQSHTHVQEGLDQESARTSNSYHNADIENALLALKLRPADQLSILAELDRLEASRNEKLADCLRAKLKI